jgi:glycosyltransferase involved in cell wall biosynthesis
MREGFLNFKGDLVADSKATRKIVRVLAVMETPWPTGGPAKNVLEFARRAGCASHTSLQAQVAVAVFHRGKPKTSNDFVSACEQLGLEVNIIGERFRFDPRVLAALQNIVESYKPDIVETHAVKSHFLIWLTRAYRKRVWVAFHHGYTWTSVKTRLYNSLDRWSLLSASHVVTDCLPFASDLKKIGVLPERIAVQHSCVNEFVSPSTERIADLRRTLRIDDGMQVILSVGRLSREKGQAYLIEAASLLRQRNGRRNMCFILAGVGPDREMLEKLARERQVSESFRFPGLVADIAPYYGLANMLVLPSHSEGSPNVLLEAMAAGLPIVATAVGGVPEMVANEKEGLLVESRNAPALAQAIERLSGEESLRVQLGKEARSKSKSYTPVAYCESLLALYERCLAQSPSP